MKNGLVLAGSACLLLGGVALWLLLGRSSGSAPPAAPVASAAGPAAPASAPRGEPLQVEPGAKSAPTAPAAAQGEGAKPTADPRGAAAPRVPWFIPYPNNGESDFKAKYAGLDLDALAQAKTALQQLLKDEFSLLTDERFAQGLHEDRIIDPRNPSAEVKEVKPPEGLGETRAAMRTEVQPDGTIKHQTTWLSQSEHPQYFAHESEYQFVVNAWKLAGGH
jgi:hypothetical protein